MGKRGVRIVRDQAQAGGHRLSQRQPGGAVLPLVHSGVTLTLVPKTSHLLRPSGAGDSFATLVG